MLVYNTFLFSLVFATSLVNLATALPTTGRKLQRRSVGNISNSSILSGNVSSNCSLNYTVKLGDVCLGIAANYNISLDDIRTLNPSINPECTNLEVESILCLKHGNASASVYSLGNDTSKIDVTNILNLSRNLSLNVSLGSVSSDGWMFHKLSQGSTFFNDFSFYGDLVPGGPDPTHGAVTFVNASGAWSNGLVNASDTEGVLMRIDPTPGVSNRNSVRIQSNDVYNAGTLIIMDASHIPAGNGLWPAFWTVGPDWPSSGEIDILEYVNLGQNSQTSFHTAPGCYIGASGMQNTSIVVGGTDCSASETGDAGCGVVTSALAGAEFNNATGGVYALVWTSSGISTYFWLHSEIPADVAAKSPTPSIWGTPMAYLGQDSCNINATFQQHSIVFDLTTCGDWAGAAFSDPNHGTGSAACEQYMQNADLSEAYWSVNNVQVYLQSN